MSDLIERQAATDEVRTYIVEPNISDDESEIKGYNDGLEVAISVLSTLPSAQPEIIRCKDCKHSEPWYRDKRRCFLWHETGIDVYEDGFCNYAERGEQDG